MVDPALVRAAREWMHGECPHFQRLTVTSPYPVKKNCTFCIAAFGAAQRANGYEQGRRDEYNEATRQAVDR